MVLSAKKSFDKGETRFALSDFFWAGESSKWRLYDYPITDSRYYPVYYLHGAIFIFNEGFSAKKRIRDPLKSNLLEAIEQEITAGEIPLFISEGTATQKRSMIYQNDYLARGFEDFKSSTGNLVIYGASLLEPDKHIIEAINKRTTNKIAISVHLPNRSEIQLQLEMMRIKQLFPYQNVYFFDSSTLF